MAGNQGHTNIMADVAELIATFVEGQDSGEKESILGELANRVLNRYHVCINSLYLAPFTLHMQWNQSF